MPFDGASSGGKRYGLDKDNFLQAAFQKGSENRDWRVMEPATKQDFCKEMDSLDLEKTGRIALVMINLHKASLPSKTGHSREGKRDCLYALLF